MSTDSLSFARSMAQKSALRETDLPKTQISSLFCRYLHRADEVKGALCNGKLNATRLLYRFSLETVGRVHGVHLAPRCAPRVATRVPASAAAARGVQDGCDEFGDVRVDLLVVHEEPMLQEGAVRGAARHVLVQTGNPSS